MNARDECAAASTAGPVELRARMIELAVAAAEIEAAEMLFDLEIRSRYIFGFARLPSLVTALGCDPRGIGSVAATKNPAASQPDFLRDERCRSGDQQVALPQRAMPIFSLRLSTPTAPITTCLPIT
ncbi:hypothetical protein SAMN05216337_101895 [Bradyrhizobium brasilense]|uniref:Uncharacterized protein n=1 Tax=Bradyrhizobium brasilense TaxID=1419277 RepID=A0A1G6ZJC8_9BRAD|nr:hypothetical protein SAMN05216337_101895 [Bradyrhizobium brasilense]